METFVNDLKAGDIILFWQEPFKIAKIAPPPDHNLRELGAVIITFTDGTKLTYFRDEPVTLAEVTTK